MIEYGWGDTTNQFYILVIRNKWTSAEMAHAIDAVYQDIKTCQHPVDIVIDVRYAVSPPLDIINVFSKTISDIPSNTDRIILINQNAIWLRLYEILKRVYGARVAHIYFVKSVSEAYKLVSQDTPPTDPLLSSTL